MSFHSNLGR